MPDLTADELDALLATQDRAGSFYLPPETLRTLVRMARLGIDHECPDHPCCVCIPPESKQ